MAHGEDTRRKVRASYVFDQLGLEVAALTHGVPVATARRWIREARAAGDDWEKARSANHIAGGGLEEVMRQTLGVIVRQTQVTMDAVEADDGMPAADKVKALASLADSYTKLTSAGRRLMPETDKLAVALDVVKRLLDFCKSRYPGNAAGLAEMLEGFGEEVVKAYG